MLPLYGLTNWMQVWIGRSVMNPQIGLDRDIPAIPESVWIYLGLFWFAYPVLLILVHLKLKPELTRSLQRFKLCS